MSLHFSAHQYDEPYKARRLLNWEVPTYYPKYPRTRKGCTKVITDNNGRFLPEVKIVDKNPFGYFRGTYQLPDRITRKFIEDYNYCMSRASNYKHFPERIVHPCEKEKKQILPLPTCPTKCETVKRALETDTSPKLKEPCDKKEEKLKKKKATASNTSLLQ